MFLIDSLSAWSVSKAAGWLTKSLNSVGGKLPAVTIFDAIIALSLYSALPYFALKIESTLPTLFTIKSRVNSAALGAVLSFSPKANPLPGLSPVSTIV